MPLRPRIVNSAQAGAMITVVEMEARGLIDSSFLMDSVECHIHTLLKVM